MAKNIPATARLAVKAMAVGVSLNKYDCFLKRRMAVIIRRFFIFVIARPLSTFYKPHLLRISFPEVRAVKVGGQLKRR
jgi:hypothetical protein